MDLSVIFLGTGGSVPSARRSTASVLVARGGERLMFDCGEGTQRQMQRSLGLTQVDEIYLTHFHADHILGLPGLLKTYDLTDRQRAADHLRPAAACATSSRRWADRRPPRLRAEPGRVRTRRGGPPRRLRGPRLPGRAQRPRLRLRPGRGGPPRPLRPRGGEETRRAGRPSLRPPAARRGGRGHLRPGPPRGRDGRVARRPHGRHHRRHGPVQSNRRGRPQRRAARSTTPASPRRRPSAPPKRATPPSARQQQSQKRQV